MNKFQVMFYLLIPCKSSGQYNHRTMFFSDLFLLKIEVLNWLNFGLCLQDPENQPIFFLAIRFQ